jgi:hypothetical protein
MGKFYDSVLIIKKTDNIILIDNRLIGTKAGHLIGTPKFYKKWI